MLLLSREEPQGLFIESLFRLFSRYLNDSYFPTDTSNTPGKLSGINQGKLKLQVQEVSYKQLVTFIPSLICMILYHARVEMFLIFIKVTV